MKIYIVCYYIQSSDAMSVSSEGYKTIEDAQKFIKSRVNKYREISPMIFADSDSTMIIKEINVK